MKCLAIKIFDMLVEYIVYETVKESTKREKKYT